MTALCAARERLASARRDDHARDDGLAPVRVRVEIVLERRTHELLDLRRDLRVVEAVLGLATGTAGRGRTSTARRRGTFADVFRGERHALGIEVVRRDVVADRFDDRGAQARVVGAAVGRWHRVDVRLDQIVRRLGPLEGELEAELHLLVVLLHVEHGAVRRHRELVAPADQRRQVLRDALRDAGYVCGRRAATAVSSVKTISRPPWRYALCFEPLRDQRRIEVQLAAEHFVIGMERDERARAARRAEVLELRLGLTALEPASRGARHRASPERSARRTAR